ncbi:MAG: 3-hydroxyacyl-ACP dehydratase FabZ [Proteobacteria bacterium]|jgi:3-hydroxyacyl-[acyl-carrier-protein] dehydratase|nr:3-hydroxyacyl-ACP dehydratase FabZ [Pseudomonadota bacterium]
MTERPFVLDSHNIIRILPHKPPAVLIDRVLEVSPGQRVLARKCVTQTDPSILGHYPGLPVFPAGDIIEAMAQACTVPVYATDKFDPATDVVLLVGLNKTKFRRVVVPGDVLEIEAVLSQRRSNVWRFDVKAFVDDFIVAETGLVLSTHARDDIL